MPRYIDADYLDELITQLNHEGRGITRNEYKMIDNILFEFPTADVVEVVRCKDCEYYIRHDKRCGLLNHGVKTDFFCAGGERREDDG